MRTRRARRPQKPPPVQSTEKRRSLTVAPEKTAPAPPTPEASSSDIDGETMFATSCGWCHQQGGRAAGRGPKLAGDKKSDDALIDRIRRGKPGAMPAFGRAFSDGQIIAILAYIRSLDDAGN
jgi:mono/diheme cytochrome c family protein